MKHMMAIAFLILALTAHLLADEPCLGDFVTVTNLWYEGHKTNVLAIAEQRLAANSNDLAGLVLVMEYNLEYSNDSCLSNDIFRVLSVASHVTNGNMCAKFMEIKTDLEDFLDFLKEDYHPTETELLEEKAKANFIHKHMTYERYLTWLNEDGLFYKNARAHQRHDGQRACVRPRGRLVPPSRGQSEV